jgi:hypothetical protein
VEGEEVKRFILKVMDHGLILAMVVGSTAMASMGFLNPGSWQSMAFLGLGAVGFLAIAGMVWAKRKMQTGSVKLPPSGSNA